MKKLIFIIAIVFSGMLMQAQEKHGIYQNKYEKRYVNSLAIKKTGMLMFTIGTGVAIGGVLIGAKGASDYNSSQEEAGKRLFYMGFTSMNIGAPLWIAGKIVSKNNRIAMENTRQNASLSFAITNNGPGLVFSF